jgi:membrane protein
VAVEDALALDLARFTLCHPRAWKTARRGNTDHMRLFGRKRPAREPQVRRWGAGDVAADDDATELPEHSLAPLPGKPSPQPERHERDLDDPGPRDLSKRDWKAIVVRAAKEAKDDGITDVAAALAYYAFVAIPAALLVTLGLFTLFAGEDTVSSMMDNVRGIVPPESIELMEESLTRALENQGGGVLMVAIGIALALWTATGAMNGLMRGLNRAYDRKETRGFVKQRLTALGMLACNALAFGLVFVLLVLGPLLSEWLGAALEMPTVFKWLWWTLQWPIMVLGLLLAFSGILYLGPNIDHPRWRFVTLGSAFAVVIWLVVSALFALYVSLFGSYNKTWGSLAAVIVMLTWLWLSSLAILFGAEINAEAERSRELRRGEPAERELTAPAKG